MANEKVYFSTIDFGDGIPRYPRLDGSDGINTISVNGVSQSIENHAVDLDIVNNLITDTQWTAIQAIFA